jgi:radical SAM superfamily enzyme
VKAGDGWVRRQIVASEEQTKEWITKPFNERYPYRGHAVRDYGQAVDEFRAQMLVLMHMTGGQPARSPEILGLRVRNTANGGVRNIFIHNGVVCFVTMYHKAFRRSNMTKVIHRYVPREVGELFVWYLWLVLPFW